MLWARQIAPESPSWVSFGAADPHKVSIDSNGNLATKTEGTDNWTYTWNAEDQLTKVEKNGVEQARFSYDPLGRRVEKVGGETTTGYTYDGNDILREVRGTSTLKYIHGADTDEALAVDDGAALSFLHADALGSVVKVTNAVGAVTLTRQYDAWGNLQAGADQAGYAFTGREWDPETGLYYYRARYYDARSGRFLSEDPLGSVGRVLMRTDIAVPDRGSAAWSTENRYIYVGANPVRYVDPLGLRRTTRRPPSPPPHQVKCPGLCGWGGSDVTHTNTGVRNGEPWKGCVWFITYFDCNCRVYATEVIIKCEQVDCPGTGGGGNAA